MRRTHIAVIAFYGNREQGRKMKLTELFKRRAELKLTKPVDMMTHCGRMMCPQARRVESFCAKFSPVSDQRKAGRRDAGQIL